MQIQPEGILNYITPSGQDPYRRWYTRIKDERTRAIITSRIERLRQGNPGDCRRLNKDLYELRIHYGPGYRIYFGRFYNNLVILLGGGIKKTQRQDIAKAQDYWNEFLHRVEEQ